MRSLSSDYHWVAIGGSLKNSGMFIDTVRRIFEEQTGCAFVKHGSGKKYGATVNEGRPVCGHTTSYTQLFATFRRLGFVSTQVAPVVARVNATTTTIHVRMMEVSRKTTWSTSTALSKKEHRTKARLPVAVDLKRTTSVTRRSRRMLPRLRRARLRPAEESARQSPLAAVTAL